MRCASKPDRAPTSPLPANDYRRPLHAGKSAAVEAQQLVETIGNAELDTVFFDAKFPHQQGAQLRFSRYAAACGRFAYITSAALMRRCQHPGSTADLTGTMVQDLT